MQFQVIMDHREPLRDITNHPDGRRGLKRPKAQTDTTLPDDHDHGKIQVYLFAAKPHDMLSLFMMQVSFRILLYDTVLAALEAKRQKARDNYAKLTDEQKAQRKAKRREAYTLKKNASRAPALVANAGTVSGTKKFKHTYFIYLFFSRLLHVDEGDTFATPVVAVLPSNEASGNIDKISCYDSERTFFVL